MAVALTEIQSEVSMPLFNVIAEAYMARSLSRKQPRVGIRNVELLKCISQDLVYVLGAFSQSRVQHPQFYTYIANVIEANPSVFRSV